MKWCRCTTVPRFKAKAPIAKRCIAATAIDLFLWLCWFFGCVAVVVLAVKDCAG
jgi:hypothetical protein